MEDEFEECIKLVMLGDTNVGKTCITLKYSDGKFNEEHISTIGVDYVAKDIEIKDKKVKIQIWDTAGQERFKNITKTYLKNGHGVLLVFDLTNKESFLNIDSWVNDIKEMTGNIQFIILGNKCDCPKREVTIEEGEKMASKYQTKYFETSAKNGTNIDEAFQCISEIAYSELIKNKEKEKENIKLNKTIKRKKKCCE